MAVRETQQGVLATMAPDGEVRLTQQGLQAARDVSTTELRLTQQVIQVIFAKPPGGGMMLKGVG